MRIMKWFLVVFLHAGFLLALPNPAYVFCVDHGGTAETRADQFGNQFGICIFDQGGTTSECSQWEYFRGNCAPGECLHWSIELRGCEIRP